MKPVRYGRKTVQSAVALIAPWHVRGLEVAARPLTVAPSDRLRLPLSAGVIPLQTRFRPVSSGVD